ncbi:MAG: Crp/Fnr family transcriptional regulator [Flavobacteriaceae bacterium]|nr:Crp/Fnr family transcriptional regulator [Flavobacteriaceae bacterium]
MKCEKLIKFLEKYGKVSEAEQGNLNKYFEFSSVKKKQIIVEKNFPCNKLFFVNDGILRTYYINDGGREITRMLAWENRFITNIESFRYATKSHEIIECVEDAEILYISREHFKKLVKASPDLKSVYADILEEYTAFYVKRFEVLNTFDLNKKIQHLKEDFPPEIIKDLNDTVLSSLIGISREYFVKNKNLFYGK